MERKCLRSEYFRQNRWVAEMRMQMGPDEFDEYYRSVYRWLSSLYFGNFFVVSKICARKPQYHDVFVACCDIYYHMDWNVSLTYDEAADTIRIHRPDHPYFRNKDHYWPPDVYSRLVARPSEWGVSPQDLTVSLSTL